MVFSPDGKRALTGSDDKTARLWDLTTDKEIASFGGHPYEVFYVWFSPDGKRIMTQSPDQKGRLWDVATRKEIAVLDGHIQAVSPDGKLVVTTSEETARLWDTRTGNEVALLEHAGQVTSALFSSDGRQIVTSSHDGTARIWKVFSQTQDTVGYGKSIAPRCLTPEQRSLFVCGRESPRVVHGLAAVAIRCRFVHRARN